MAGTPVISVTDGPRLTVSSMIKSPTVIPKRILKIMQNQFIVDFLLRKLPQTDSGVYMYEESTPLFADGDIPIVNEFGEIPVLTGRVGARKAAFTVKRAGAVVVSEEMRRRNDLDQLNRQIIQLRNSMTRTWATVFFQTLLAHPDVPSINAIAPWDDGTLSRIRKDLSAGIATVENAHVEGDEDNFFGFAPNTLVIGTQTKQDLITSDDFNKVFRQSPLAVKAPEYVGVLPGDFYGLTIVVAREMDRLARGKALILERGTLGGIGDERPLQATPLYERREAETWRTDVSRQSAILVDQPQSAVWINGVGQE